MAGKRKAMPTVKLERHPHWEAKERLRQAYQLLIEAQQITEQNAEVKEDQENKLQEVMS